MNTTLPTAPPTDDVVTTLDEAKLEVTRKSAEVQAIDQELDRLASAKAVALAKFTFACQHLARLTQQHKEATA